MLPETAEVPGEACSHTTGLGSTEVVIVAQQDRTMGKRRLDAWIDELRERLDILEGRLKEALEDAREPDRT
jgi:hypothetical protein